jgi:hypothetical protein
MGDWADDEENFHLRTEVLNNSVSSCFEDSNVDEESGFDLEKGDGEG